MEQMDAQLETMVKSKAGEPALEFCIAATEVTSPVPAPLIPISIIGFSVLSFLTGIGLFAFVSLGIIIASLAYFFTHYKNYVVAATESGLALLRVSGNLQTCQEVRRLPYGEILSVTERSKAGKMVVEIETRGELLKLHFITRHAASSQTRAANLYRILREKVAAAHPDPKTGK